MPGQHRCSPAGRDHQQLDRLENLSRRNYRSDKRSKLRQEPTIADRQPGDCHHWRLDSIRRSQGQDARPLDGVVGGKAPERCNGQCNGIGVGRPQRWEGEAGRPWEGGRWCATPPDDGQCSHSEGSVGQGSVRYWEWCWGESGENCACDCYSISKRHGRFRYS